VKFHQLPHDRQSESESPWVRVVDPSPVEIDRKYYGRNSRFIPDAGIRNCEDA